MKQKLPYTICLLLFLFSFNFISAQTVFINEIHYDNVGADTAEGIEVAGPAGTDLSVYTLELYNGADQLSDGPQVLTGIIPDQQNGYGTIFFPISGLQNGSADGFALVKDGNTVIQFLSYEGSFTAADGPAAGMESTDIIVEESGSTPVGYSLQLGGSGTKYSDFTWQAELLSTYNAIDMNQDFGGGGVVVTTPVFINEVDADTQGTDAAEFIELYDGGVGNTSLDGKIVVLFNGSNSQSYLTFDLTGYSTNANGYFVLGDPGVANVDLEIPANKIQNGADAIALYTATPSDFPNGTDLTTDSLEDAFVYDTDDGDNVTLLALLNDGQPQINENGGGDKDNQSSQRYPNGSGELRNTDTYVQALPTPGTANSNLTEKVDIVINETDADTPGGDSEEFVELYDGGVGNVPLDGFAIVFYNGSNDLSYNTFDLSGYTTNAEGYFVLGDTDVKNVNYVVSNGFIQNGADAVALYKDSASNFPNSSSLTTANLIDAVVYGTGDAPDNELLALLNDGQLQLDEDANGNGDIESLQRIPNGEGGARNTSSFQALEPTPGTENGVEVVVPHGELITISEARAKADGEMVTVEGTLTVTDQFYGPAYLQDESGAIAIYDESVYGDGIFEIGTSIKITAVKTSFNGQIELINAVRVDDLGEATAPIVPLEITLDELSQHPDELVTISNVSFANDEIGKPLLGNSNFNISDASGAGILRIDNGTTDFFGKAIPESCSQITGIAADVYFNIIPRRLEDFPCAAEYNPNNGIDVSYDKTLDVVAWNLEFFGYYSETEHKAPAPPEVQKEAVKNAIISLNADVIAVEEVVNVDLFKQMVSELDGYGYILSDDVSYPNNPDDSFGTQRVGFIYKKDVIKINDSKALLESIHPYYNGGNESYLEDYPTGTPSQFWASGRLPFIIETTVTVNGQTSDYDFVVIHAKSGAGSEEYQRREYDNKVLKDSLDTYYGDQNVVLLGDYNDDVDQTIVENYVTTASSYYPFINDDDYRVVTSTLSDQGYRSTVSFSDVIDHITITNELFDNYLDNSSAVHYELYDGDYASTTSDHFPVSARFELQNIEVASVSYTNATCNGSATGSASVFVSGGITPYSYEWSDGQTGATASNLKAGDYTVTVTDALQNSVTAEVTIAEPEPLQLTLSDDQNIHVGYETECVTLSTTEVSGGTPGYSYEWSNGGTTNAITVCTEETTTYTLTVTDANGCTATNEVTVNVENVSCGKGNGQDKISICYKGKQKCVARPAVAGFLRKGAILGSCGNNQEQFIVQDILASPNPATSQTTIKVIGNGNYKAQLVLFDLNGNPLKYMDVHIKKGEQQYNLGLNGLATGIYIVKVQGNGFESDPVKIIKY